MCTAAILAGGRARRLGGRSKALLPIGDQRIIDHQIAVLRTVADELAIVAADTDRYGALGVPVWVDLIPDSGPLGGIYTALVNATSSHTLIVASDMPFVTASFLKYLVRVGQNVDVAIPRTTDGHQPLCACYAGTCVSVVRRHIESGALKVTDLLSELKVHEIGPAELQPFDPDDRLFFNVNTPDDYDRCVKLMAGRPE
ncbi:MAG: molybdenum cofactor guanylyltransferase [Vicinamibacterales bacterium]